MAQKIIKTPDEKLIKELAGIRKAIEEIELLRYSAHKKKTEREVKRLEEGSVELKERERKIIKKIGEGIAAKIESDGESLEELTLKLKARIERMGRLPKRLDKLSKVILKISDLFDF